ncbi:MAG: prepilin peptidase [Christensenellales bacterium]|jgi:Flp pilus assembly protein protease CpaA
MIYVLCILTDAFFIALLVWCARTDWKTRTVSNVSVILLLFLGLAHMTLMTAAGNTWWTYPAGMAMAVPFFITWLRGQMGAGDVKLVMGVCLYLGVLNTLIAFALMIPALIGLMVRSWMKTKTFKSAIPFAPVLALGAGSAVAIGYLYALLQL